MKKRSYIDRETFSPFRLCSTCAVGFLPARKILREFRTLGLLPFLFPALQVVRGRGGGGLGMHLVLCPGGLPPLPLGSSERGGSASGLSSVARRRAPASLAPAGASEGGVARSQRNSLARSASSVASPHSSPHAR